MYHLFSYSYETFKTYPELQPIFLLCIEEPYLNDFYANSSKDPEYTLRH
jgi:hypothetical protein